MRIDAGQYARMEQRLKLSPRMIQSMEILQLPTMALEERIEQEMESNPVLETVENEADGPTTSPDGAAGSADQPLVVDGSGAPADGREFERVASFSEQYGDSWMQNTQESAAFRTPVRRDEGQRNAKMDAMANTASRAASLGEQLKDQWRFVDAAEPVSRAGEHLIEFIDDDGYLRTGLEDVAERAPGGMTADHLAQALELIQAQLEPRGIGARDLKQCLLIQLDTVAVEPGEADALDHARLLVEGHLKDIELNRLPRIAQKTKLSLDEINRGLALLRRLDPRPGRQLAPPRVEMVVPDIIVEYDPVNDAYVSAIARGRQPALRINPGYARLATDKEQDRSTRKYLSNGVNQARWLIDAVEQRTNTVLRVANVVLAAQREFLDYGVEHLKPLPMVQVAEQLGIHVGTVSRAVSEKYMQTPRGIFPLRMFFSGGTETSSGEEMSWRAVQAKLKQIIDAEDASQPFSDDQLVQKLEDQGIRIARRTVAKYRQQLKIPPARRRRQF